MFILYHTCIYANVTLWDFLLNRQNLWLHAICCTGWGHAICHTGWLHFICRTGWFACSPSGLGPPPPKVF